MPDVVVIAGPNGAGKSTLAPDLLKKFFNDIPFINADTIAEGLLETRSVRNVEIESGRIMLSRLRQMSAREESFAFETTLSARSYVPLLERLKEKGYSIQITYLWLADVELSIQRVAERVRVGGHDIPIDTVVRRFNRGRRNFFDLYLPLADAWRCYDASGDEPQMIASGDKILGEVILDQVLWQKVKN
jgi:predicted ABC-type ATPase